MINYYLQQCLLSSSYDVSIDYLLFLSEESQSHIDSRLLREWIEKLMAHDIELACSHEMALITRLSEKSLASYIPVHASNLPVMLDESADRLGVQYLLEHYESFALSYADALTQIVDRLNTANKNAFNTRDYNIIHSATELFIESTTDQDSVKILYQLLQTPSSLIFEHPALMFYVLKQKKRTSNDDAYINNVLSVNPKPYLLYVKRKKITLNMLSFHTRHEISNIMPGLSQNILGIDASDDEKLISVEDIKINVDWLSNLYYGRVDRLWTRVMTAQSHEDLTMIEPYARRYFLGEDKQKILFDFCGEKLNIAHLHDLFYSSVENQKKMNETLGTSFSLSDTIKEFLAAHCQDSISEINIHF